VEDSAGIELHFSDKYKISARDTPDKEGGSEIGGEADKKRRKANGSRVGNGRVKDLSNEVLDFLNNKENSFKEIDEYEEILKRYNNKGLVPIINKQLDVTSYFKIAISSLKQDKSLQEIIKSLMPEKLVEIATSPQSYK
jgi:5'-deoxynucleotidase YfbR-like HD superfamily hydrolase